MAIRGWFIGCYTGDEPDTAAGIGCAPVDLGSWRVSVRCPNPSFLVNHEERVYACLEGADGAVAAYQIGPGGALRPLSRPQPTQGAAPCHLVVHDGCCYSANYGSGSIAVHPVRPDGSLSELVQLVQHTGYGPESERQAAAHPHQVVVAPDGYLLAVDLGADSVVSYAIGGDGTLTEHARAQTHPGAGPRHLAFHPSGAVGYLLDELDSTMIVFSYADGRLELGQTVDTRAAGSGIAPQNYPAEVVAAADGRHVYVSNRGDDTVALFAADPDGLAVELVEATPSGATWPRHLVLTGPRLYTVNERGNAIVEFAVDAGSGRLQPTGLRLEHPNPTCLLPIEDA